MVEWPYLSEDLVLDGNTSNVDVVLRQEALNTTATVEDVECGAVLDVSGGLGGVVLVVEIASNRVPGALG